MDEQQYYGVAQFADLAGVTKQAVYKRLDKDLAEYCKVIAGKKYIAAEALKLYTDDTVDVNQVKELNNHQVDTVDRGMFNYLRLQLEEKEKIIAAQQATITDQGEQIKGLTAHIVTQSNDLMEQLKKQNQMQENLQLLVAREQELVAQIKLLQEQNTVETVEMVEQQVEQSVEQQVETAQKPIEDNQDPEAARKTFWQRLKEAFS